MVLLVPAPVNAYVLGHCMEFFFGVSNHMRHHVDYSRPVTRLELGSHIIDINYHQYWFQTMVFVLVLGPDAAPTHVYVGIVVATA